MTLYASLTSRSFRWVALLLGGVLALVVGPVATAQQTSPDQGADRPTRVSPAVQAAPAAVQRAVERAFHGLDGAGKDGPMAAVGRDLIALHQQYEARGVAGVNRLMGREEGTPTRKGRRASRTRLHSPVSADGRFVRVDGVAEGAPAALLDDLRQLGLQGGATAGNVVSGRLPIAAIEAAAGLASLRGMQASYARTHGVSRPVGADSVVISEADTAHSAVEGRASLGVDGNGEKICALSDSYDNPDANTTPTDASGSLQDADADVSEGELPGANNPYGNTAQVDVLDDSQAGSDEGRAMLQLIHDIAPGAELGFHTAFGGLGDFADGIRELADAGCTVIVDDVGYSVQPFYQDGVVANAVDDVVTNDDVAYFSSAGNDGQNSYEAPFRNSGQAGVLDSSAVRHNFDGSGSTDTEQQITVEDGGTFQVWTLQWTDPSSLVSSTGADTDLDVALVNQSDSVVASGQGDNVRTGRPVEGPISYTNSTGGSVTLNLVIEKVAGPDPDEVKYVYKGNGFTIDDQYGNVGTATIYGHPMAAGAEAVAAAPFYYTDAYRNDSNLPWLESFSSKGGIQIRFDQSGNELTTYETRNKPDVTGADGNDNTFFGSDITAGFVGDGDPHPNFFGTSAAAPNVAAIAALVREANPGYGPTEVYDHLEVNATNVTRRVNENDSLEAVASGEDPWSGHGFVQATGAALPVELASFGATAAESRAVLRWTTASETNNAGFTVQHRRGDGAFRALGFVESEAAGGTTTASTSYRYRTPELRVGTHTFRLRQEDIDGTTTQSQTVTVEVALSGSHRVSSVTPNPVQQSGTVAVTVKTAQQVRAAVYNALGQRVAVLHDGRMPADDPTVLRVGEGLQNGVYLLRVEGKSFSATQKFVRVQ